MTFIRPSIGRAVWFYPHGRMPDGSGQQPLAATVAYVHGDRLVNLGYIDAGGMHHSAGSVPLVQEGEEEPAGPFCCWMPFQIGQAKAQQAGGAA